MRQLIRKVRSQRLFRENLSWAFNLHFMSLHEKNISQDESWGASAVGSTHNGPKCGNCNSSETFTAPRSDHDLTQQTVSRFFHRQGAISDPAREHNSTSPKKKEKISDPQNLDAWLPPAHGKEFLCPTIARVVRSWRLYSRNTDFLCLCWWCVVSFGRPVPRNYYAHALKAKATKGDRRRRHKVSLIIKFRPRYLLLCRKHKNIFMLPRLVFSAFFLKPISEISIFGLKVNLCASAGRVQAFRGSAVLA